MPEDEARTPPADVLFLLAISSFFLKILVNKRPVNLIEMAPLFPEGALPRGANRVVLFRLFFFFSLRFFPLLGVSDFI